MAGAHLIGTGDSVFACPMAAHPYSKDGEDDGRADPGHRRLAIPIQPRLHPPTGPTSGAPQPEVNRTSAGPVRSVLVSFIARWVNQDILASHENSRHSLSIRSEMTVSAEITPAGKR